MKTSQLDQYTNKLKAMQLYENEGKCAKKFIYEIKDFISSFGEILKSNNK